ncbi:hypothetical protein [Variovorax sp. GT1P44]|uniref:hypothetical protein n=1 Tax=Variovorax sp. GT1P44 TaxID=3443742 RepID=UPI003F452420
MTATVDKVDELRDERLWQALEYAPDQNAAPDWRLRKAILKKAGDAVGAVDPYEAEAALELAARPWWRGGASEGKRSRLPWVALFATLLVALLVTMLWRRDPVIAPQRDAEPKVAEPAPQAPPIPGLAEPGPPSNQVASRTASSSPSAPPSAPPSVAKSAPPAPSPSVPPSALLPSTALPEPPPMPVAAPNPPVASAAPAPSVKSQPKTPSPTTPPASTPKREGAEATAKPVPPTIPAVPPQASTEVARAVPTPAPAPAPAPSPNVRTEATEPPTFSALSQWTRMTIARRGGETRTVQREEARDLNALLGSAAISAVGSQPMRATAEYRVTLERNGNVLAVFEVAPTQVRWREGKTPPATGVPSAPALAALREALRDTVQQEPVTTPTFAPPRNP